MFACRWFEVFVLVSSVAHTNSRQEVLRVPHLSQSEAEAILSTQTFLRVYFINSLADVRKRIIQSKSFASVLGEIIQDLQTRDLNPFKFLGSVNTHKQSPTAVLAEAIYNLQGGKHGPTRADWNSLLETVPVGQQPTVQLTPEHLQKVQEGGEGIVGFVLTGIHKRDIKLNGRLLGDVLYNFRFTDYSPELVMILDNINQTLAGSLESLDFHSDGASIKTPEQILTDILNLLLRKKQSDAGFVYQVGRLLSALSAKGSAIDVKDVPELVGLLDLMLRDDYPPDIIRAKDDLSFAIRNNQIGVDLSRTGEAVKGHRPMEKLLMLVGKLSFLSTGSPFSRAVRAVFPHVKLRHLTAQGKFFRPRTPSDLQFLLGSFLTGPDQMDSAIVGEVEKILTLSDWDAVLKNFDYSRYSRPRSLVMDMVQGLLENARRLPICSVIILRYFLRKNRQVLSCAENVLTEELTKPGTRPFSWVPTMEVATASSLLLQQPFRSEWGTSQSSSAASSAVAVATTPPPEVGSQKSTSDVTSSLVAATPLTHPPATPSFSSLSAKFDLPSMPPLVESASSTPDVLLFLSSPTTAVPPTATKSTYSEALITAKLGSLAATELRLSDATTINLPGTLPLLSTTPNAQATSPQSSAWSFWSSVTPENSEHPPQAATTSPSLLPVAHAPSSSTLSTQTAFSDQESPFETESLSSNAFRNFTEHPEVSEMTNFTHEANSPESTSNEHGV